MAESECAVPLFDRVLEHGRIIQSNINEEFDLFLSIHGKAIKVAKLESEAEAISCYDKTMTILKPAVHDPFNASSLKIPSDIEKSLNLGDHIDHVNSLAMFQHPLEQEKPISSSSTSASSSSPTTSHILEKKIALKTLAAPVEDPMSRRRKLISQKGMRSSLNAMSNKRMKEGSGRSSGGGRKTDDLKKDIFTDYDPAVFYDSLSCHQVEGGGEVVVSDVSNRVCTLCGGGEESYRSMLVQAWDAKSLKDELCRDYDGNGLWLRKPLQMSRGRPGAWVHWACAVYSPQAFLGMNNLTSGKDGEEEVEGRGLGRQGEDLPLVSTQSNADSNIISDEKKSGGHGEGDSEIGENSSNHVEDTPSSNTTTSSTLSTNSSTCWYNITKEVARGRRLICTACGQKGATIGCQVEGCNVNLHLPCAVLSEGYRLPVPWLRETNPFSCAKHAIAAIKEASKITTSISCDVSGGIENTAVQWVRSSDSDQILPSGFVYASKPIYDVEVPVLGLSATELPNQCLKEKSFYSIEGKLPLSTSLSTPCSKLAIIEECGVGAPCSMNCSGRLVFRGISKQLEIFPLLVSSSSSSTPTFKPQKYPTLNCHNNQVENWGLRTKDPLCIGDFVCEFIGRIAPANRNDIVEALTNQDRRVSLIADWLPEEFDPQTFLPTSMVACPPLAMDSRNYGNVARFIRKANTVQGEEPNLVMQAVFTDTQNPHAPRLALFAKQGIKRGTELLR